MKINRIYLNKNLGDYQINCLVTMSRFNDYFSKMSDKHKAQLIITDVMHFSV